MDMIATTFDMRAPFEGWRLRSGDRTVTTKGLQWSATSAERRTFERDFQAERRAGLVRGFPNIAVLPDRPPDGSPYAAGDRPVSATGDRRSPVPVRARHNGFL